MMHLDIDTTGIDQLSQRLGATERQIDAARARALAKMRKKIEKRIKQEVAREERIPQYGLNDRVFSSRVKPGDEELKVWIGVWNISPFSLGTPSQTARGVRVGRRSYPGAFLAEIYGGEQKVWIRLHSKHYSPDLYPTQYRPGDRGLTEHRGRFPVVRAAIPIDGAVERVLATNGPYFEKEFEKLYSQELNYEINVRGVA